MQRSNESRKTLLVLPGSRRTEIQTLMEPFGQAVGELAARTEKLDVVLPTLPRIEEMVRDLSKNWAVKPLIVLGDEEKWKAFSRADAALAASGRSHWNWLSHVSQVCFPIRRTGLHASF